MSLSTPARTGACHCGRIAFAFETEIDVAISCNCSICRQVGALWHGVPADRFRVLRGVDEANIYRFGTMTASHYFCTHCGNHPFIRPRLAPAAWAVNLRCIPGIDLDQIAIEKFDGINWDSAAARWIQHRRRSV